MMQHGRFVYSARQYAVVSPNNYRVPGLCWMWKERHISLLGVFWANVANSSDPMFLMRDVADMMCVSETGR